MDALGLQLLANATAGAGGDGAGIRCDRSRFGAFDDAVGAGEDLLGHARIAHAGEDEVGLFGHLLGRGARSRFFLRGELPRFARRMRPHSHLVPGARQIPRHGIAHQTQSKKSKLCHTPASYQQGRAAN